VTLPLKIRRADLSDAALLAEFAARTFEETFGAENAADDMAAHLASSYSAGRQRDEIASPDIITLLVEDDGQLAGYAQVRRNRPPIEPAPEKAVELWRFYVDRPWHGHGVASLMMSAAKDAATALGGQQMWLSVWERNPRAIGFYSKCGFRTIGSKDFWVGSDRQTDHVMTVDMPATDSGLQAPGRP
jgi:diamine N-acetyltransferase